MNKKTFRSISIISYMFYLYLVFLIARSIAYPRDIPLHIIIAAISLVIYIIFDIEPSFLKSFINKSEIYLTKNKNKVIFIPISIALFLGLIYSFFPNPFFIDENHHLNATIYILTDGLCNFFKNYELMPWLGPQHPFFIPLINSIALRAFGAHLYVMRAVTLIFSIFTLLLVYLLCCELFY